MLTIYDLNNITAYFLELQGPMLPVDIRRAVERIVREGGLFIKPWWSEEEIERIRNGVIDVTQSPPMQAITQQLESWDRDNPNNETVVHLFFAGSPSTRENRRRRQEWEMSHPGGEDIIEHEFSAGTAMALTTQQKEEVKRFLSFSNQSKNS